MLEVTDTNHKWDGTFMGEPQPAGVYVYVLNEIFENNISRQYKGEITLLK